MIKTIKKQFTLIILTIFLTVSWATSPVNSQDETEILGTEGAGEGLTAREMVDESLGQTRGESSYGVMTMQVVTPDWDRNVEMEWWERGEDLMLVRILSPARDESNGTLKIERNLWNYIYAFDETVHIPPAMMAQSWMGSDFTNDDIVREASLIDDYDHELTGIEEIEGEQCYSILMTTDPSTPVPWLTMKLYLRVEDLLPVRQEYYDDDGELARYMVMSDFVFMHDRIIPATMRMVPMDEEGHYTEMRYTEIEFDLEIPDDIFTLQTLENP